MAWDDEPPTAEELKAISAPQPATAHTPGAEWDSTPPTAEEMKIIDPQWSDLPSHIIPNAKEIASGIGGLLSRTAKGVSDLPADINATGEAMDKGKGFMDTPVGQDASTVGKTAAGVVTSIPKLLKDVVSKEAWINHPVSNAMTVAPFVGGAAGKLLGSGAEAAEAADLGAASAIPRTPPLGAEAAETGATGAMGAEAGKAAENAVPVAGEAATEAVPKGLGAIPGKMGDYVNKKLGDSIGSSLPTQTADRLKEIRLQLLAKDLGMQPLQLKSMGPGFEGLKKAEALVNWSDDQKLFNPTLSDASRRAKIADIQDTNGEQVGQIRKLADSRGAPPVQAIQQEVINQLNQKYGSGVERSPQEIKNVMEEFQKYPPTHEGMADMATALNKSATKVTQLGQHSGPATDAANIIGRMSNDSVRALSTPEESATYTNALRNYGAAKKLEQITAGAARRAMVNRSILGPFQRMWQEALDRGGYRMGANLAGKMSGAIRNNPGVMKSLPSFFEEFAHQADSTVDDLVTGLQHGMSAGGVVSPQMRQFVGSR